MAAFESLDSIKSLRMVSCDQSSIKPELFQNACKKFSVGGIVEIFMAGCKAENISAAKKCGLPVS